MNAKQKQSSPTMLSIEQAQRRAEDLRTMSDPIRWPRWPLLPVKRPNPEGGIPICGVMFAGDRARYASTVFEKVNLFGSKAGQSYAQFLATGIERAYPDLAALLDAGWEVD